MKGLLTAAALIAGITAASAQFNYGTGSNSSGHAVQGYTTNSGTYVAPHFQTNPNSTTHDNYGASGNVNPYTGRTGRGY